MTVSEILGCASATNKRRNLDFYETAGWCTVALIEAESRMPRTLWEPFAGRGAIADVLEALGKTVIETDVKPRRQGQRCVDFLDAVELQALAIVSNPPFKIATEIIRHAHDIGVRYLALLLKADFMNADKRAQMVRDVGYPHRIWALTKRPDFTDQGAPPMNCSWHVWNWRAGYAQHSIVRLLDVDAPVRGPRFNHKRPKPKDKRQLDLVEYINARG